MVKYDIFTYQISPLTTSQLDLFGRDYSQEELVKQKNAFFADIFSDLTFYSRRHRLNYKVEYQDEEFILIRIANKKWVKIERDFQQETHESEPSCLVAFYNSPEIQLIAIESDKSSFGNSFMVLNIVEKAIDRKLSSFGLRFYPQPKYEQQVLWELLKRYEGRIEKLKFEFAKPNLARVNETLSEELKEAGKMFNSAVTKIEFNAPEDQVLENLSDDNPQLVDLVITSSEGAGPAKFKLDKIRRWETTETTVKSIELENLEIEGDANTISNFVENLKEILKGE